MLLPSFFNEAAKACVQDILARGKVPLFVGGTPLYLKALLRGLFDGPSADWSIRQELQEVVDRTVAELELKKKQKKDEHGDE